ncbi:MAG: mechanosensitive ion channel [Flavobacteriales bacterium]|nr:mechanosensitive ion channel [Flavobacteriales bacterium]
MEPTEVYHTLIDSFRSYFSGIIAGLPNLASGLVVLLLGWVAARLLRALLLRTGRVLHLDAHADRLGISAVFGRFGSLTLTGLLAGLVYYLILFVFVSAAAQVMHLNGVTHALDRFLAYLPTLLTAVVIFIGGFWAADKVKAMVSNLMDSIGLAGGKIVARLLFALILLFMTITAVNVAGIDTSLITNNILILIAGVLIAFAIAYGTASREILTNILSSYYGKDRFRPGMRIRIGQDEGVVENVDSISITLRTADRLVVLPTRVLINERIEVLDGGAPTE